MEDQLLKKCQKWYEQDQHEKIIEALEALEERSAKLDSELARAYNNQADHTTKEGRALLQKAVAVLLQHESSMQDDALWHYRLAYAYYYLEQEHQALEHFLVAHELDPEDVDAPMFIQHCQAELSVPLFKFSHPFAHRCQDAWQNFALQEAHLRDLLATEQGIAAINLCQEIFLEALDGVSLELGKNEERYELVFTPEGNVLELFALVHLCKQAPQELLKNWSFVVGRQAMQGIALRVEDIEVSADDVFVSLSTDDPETQSFQLKAYCPKLAALDKKQVWWMLTTLTDVVLGEVAHMRYIAGFELSDAPLAESCLLSKLPEELQKRKCDLKVSAAQYLDNCYTSYKLNNPQTEDDSPLRRDIVVGSSRLSALINEWFDGEHDSVEQLHNNGIAAGFIFFAIESLEQGMEWRTSLERELNLDEGQACLCLVGGAVGLKYGYIDVLAWDLPKALTLIERLGQEFKIPEIKFQTFRSDIDSITVVDADDECDEDMTGRFLGFVLLEQAQFDAAHILSELKAQWGIGPNPEPEPDLEQEKDSLVFNFNDHLVAICLMRGPVPNQEAEEMVQRNYLWPQGLEQVKKHQAHLLVTIVGDNEDPIERGLLFTKVAATCVHLEGSLGIYTNGTVFAPDFYYDLAQLIKANDLPINNWIWFGIWRNKDSDKYNAYTCGMRSFGKLEMEVLDVEAKPAELREFLCNMAHYVIAQDVTLQDGETIGFSAEDKHSITQSKGVSGAVDDVETLKISFEAQEPSSNDSSSHKSQEFDFDLASIAYGDSYADAQDLDERIEFDFDDAAYHIESIKEKQLSIDPINAYNHMAIFLRWSIEQGLIDENLLQDHVVLVSQDLHKLREFIRDELDGVLSSHIFTDVGYAFARYYYDCEDFPYYPSDVDQYALGIFGYQRCKEEFKTEAYLFVEFNEEYYQGLSAVISKTFANWKNQSFDYSTFEPSELAEKLINYLNCPCIYFPSMKDDDPIWRAYHYCLLEGKAQGYVPVLVQADDETLLECLTMDFDSDENYAFNAEAVAAYRKEKCATILKDGAQLLAKLLKQYREDLADDEIEESEWQGRMAGGSCIERCANYWNYDSEFTKPVVLAKIPVKEPWKVFAYLPFGGWNECPDTLEHMAVAKYWYQKFGALPAALSHDELEFYLPQPLDKEQALQTAQELYGYCPDMDQNYKSVGQLADTLTKSHIMYIWWD